MYKRINPSGYGIYADKVARLLPEYEWFFAPFVGKEIKLLELGVHKGASVRLWHDYFENATIVGLDMSPVCIDDLSDRIIIYRGHQQDTELLDRIAREQAPEGFDVIIDDCSHVGRLSRISFWHLFLNHLKPGGIYAIEDWGTGYMNWWSDGTRLKPKSRINYSAKDRLLDSFVQYLSRTFPRYPRLTRIPARLFIGAKMSSHTYGMAGFVKELLDACSMGEIAHPKSGDGRYRHYLIAQVNIRPNLVIVVKSNRKSEDSVG